MSDQVQPADTIQPMAGKKKKKEKLSPSRADYKQGREHLKKGDLVEAAVCFHNALKGFEQQGDEQGIANAADRLGDVCLERDELGMALDNFKQAREICRKFKDPDSVFSLNQKIVNVYWRMGKHDQALATCFDILDHFHAGNNPHGTVEIMDTIATIYMEMGKNGEAADTYRTIASIHANFGHKRLAERNREKAAAAEQAGGNPGDGGPN